MSGSCTLCGYIGELNATATTKEKICLMCFLRFYADRGTTEKEEDKEMAWNDVGGKGERKNTDVIKFTPNTSKLMHILLPDNEEPVSYWTHYIPNRSANGPKGRVVICPGKDICPACADSSFRTKRMHAINVWDYEAKAVKILEGGNSIFQVIKQIKEQIGTLLTTDISIKRIGSGKDTEYSVIPIPMSKNFDPAQVGALLAIDRKAQSPQEIEKIIGGMSGGIGEIAPLMDGAIPNYTPPVSAPTPTVIPKTSDGKVPVLQFGKYKGKTVEEVYIEDANYIKWCADNISDPIIKAEAKRVMGGAGTIKAPQPKPVISDNTEKMLLITEINDIFNGDPRYIGKFALILDKMRLASTSTTHPNGKTIVDEYTVEELQKLKEGLKNG